MEVPRVQHWALVKQIMHYMHGTIGYRCVYRAGSLEPVLIGYSDNDHAGKIDECKSMMGTLFFLGSSIITRASQKQKIVTLSSCEVEYVAAATTACQGLWLSRARQIMGTKPSKFRRRFGQQIGDRALQKSRVP